MVEYSVVLKYSRGERTEGLAVIAHHFLKKEQRSNGSRTGRWPRHADRIFFSPTYLSAPLTSQLTWGFALDPTGAYRNRYSRVDTMLEHTPLRVMAKERKVV